MIKRKIILGLNILFMLAIMTLPVLGFAQTGVSSQSSAASAGDPLVECEKVDTCNWNAFMRTLNKIKNYTLQLATVMSVIFIVYAGILYLTAAGNTGKISQAQNILSNVVIGFFLASAGWLIINAITKTLEVDPQFVPTEFKK